MDASDEYELMFGHLLWWIGEVRWNVRGTSVRSRDIAWVGGHRCGKSAELSQDSKGLGTSWAEQMDDLVGMSILTTAPSL